MQFHEVIRLEDPDRIFAHGGGMEAMQAAQKAGKLRFIGFTGHKDPLVHLRMLEVAATRFRFDAVQMPLNVMDAHFRSFGRQVVPLLVKEQIGVLGMKSDGQRHHPAQRRGHAHGCLHYAMSLPDLHRDYGHRQPGRSRSGSGRGSRFQALAVRADGGLAAAHRTGRRRRPL